MTDMRTDIETEVELPVCLPDPRPSDPLEALSWLGETEEEVVKALRERGIKGQQMDPNSCLIAQYLGVWWESPSVGPIDFELDEKGEGPIYSTPDVITSVIEHFDDGRYPDLITD